MWVGAVLECARALLAVRNVELNVQNKLGDTALHNAAWKGHAEVVALLLEKGRCKSGSHWWCTGQQYRQIVGALTNLQNNEKQIPYDLSARNPEVGRLLMVRGEWVWQVGGVSEVIYVCVCS